ncbi:MAG: NAD-dependent epimerase/dehydratase family protein [Bacteroidota bacterium]|nr:NAD-dependent epimerase/dehydratase family protein [Bacteroidota bacterium]MDX5430876.1 NAD-dependent epimerase/dehydratase family protein [Bacteroidota bacterium]MDX5469621.1 NAD-dependent epimerase/dehydratase family protein [Bacteroidota bacterium]
MILVTGATGFLGAHTCATLLQRGQKVRACRRASSDLQEFENILRWRLGEEWKTSYPSLEWAQADVLDYDDFFDACKGVEAVFHIAAIVSFWSKRRDELYAINVEGTANVVNACLANNIPWLIHTSSIAAIGRDKKTPSIREENEWVNSPYNSQYAISKHLAELEVWRGREEGLKASMVNPGVILGEGDWSKGSCRLMHKIMQGMSIYTDAQNGYVDVMDVAEAMVRLYEKQIDNERVILVGENISAYELIKTGAEVFGKSAPGFKVKPWMLQIAWRLSAVVSWFTNQEPLITKETARTGTHRYTYSNEKAKTLLGMRFTPIKRSFERVRSVLQA